MIEARERGKVRQTEARSCAQVGSKPITVSCLFARAELSGNIGP